MTVHNLRESRKGATVIFTQISRMKEKYSESLFCCFEGDDAKYYFNRIENKTGYPPEKIISLQCSGKKEVIRLYRLIKDQHEYSSIKFLYFIDRDFDNKLSEDGIYETPVYSIENFYTTFEAFIRILRAEFHYHEDDAEWEVLIQMFKQRQSEFHQETKLFNAWLACQRDHSNQESAVRINLDNFSLNKIVQVINLDTITSKYDKSLLENLFPTAFKLNDSEINSKIKYLEQFDLQQVFRGKFEIDFLFEFIESIKVEYGKKDKSRLIKKDGFQLNQSKKNMLGEFSHYASTSTCLVSYLLRFKIA